MDFRIKEITLFNTEIYSYISWLSAQVNRKERMANVHKDKIYLKVRERMTGC